MSENGKRIFKSAKEALAFARGEAPAASVWVNGHQYFSRPIPSRDEVLEEAAIKAACKAHSPDLFSDDPEISHMADSPYIVEIMQSKERNRVVEAIGAYFRALKRGDNG